MPGHKDVLQRALSELRVCRKALQDDDNTLDCAVFHAHQCVERTFKGYLIFRGWTLERTHDLEYLLNLCRERDSGLSILEDDVKKLSPYAMHTGYPGDPCCTDRQEAEQAIKTAKKIFEFVRSKIEDPDQTMNLF
jgi:HEPN domain-containing protein